MKKDQRREDLIVPYVPPSKSNDPDMSGTMASTLPMIAIVTRNKMLGWTAVLFALQSWLVEPPTQKGGASTSSYFSVLMAIMSVVMSYLPLFLPPVANQTATGTEAAPPQPPS